MTQEFRAGRLSYEEREYILNWLGEHATEKFRRNMLYTIERPEVFNNAFHYAIDIYNNNVEYYMEFESKRHEQIFNWLENGTGIYGSAQRPIVGRYNPLTGTRNALRFLGTNQWAGIWLTRMSVKGIKPKYNYKKTVIYMKANDVALRRQARRELKI